MNTSKPSTANGLIDKRRGRRSRFRTVYVYSADLLKKHLTPETPNFRMHAGIYTLGVDRDGVTTGTIVRVDKDPRSPKERKRERREMRERQGKR